MSTATWALHNSLRGWTLFNLQESEVRLLLLGFSENELKLARIAAKGESKWHHFDRIVHAALINPQETKAHLDGAGYPVLNSGSEAERGSTDYFVIKPNKVHHPRLHRRFDVKVSCSLVGANRDFKTETVDVSEGGLYLKDVIPAWIAGYFLVVVDDKYQLMCSMVEDQKEKKRVQIVSEESDSHFIQYKNWLATLG